MYSVTEDTNCNTEKTLRIAICAEWYGYQIEWDMGKCESGLALA